MFIVVIFPLFSKYIIGIIGNLHDYVKLLEKR